MNKTDFLAPADLRIAGSRLSVAGDASYSLKGLGTGRLPDGALVYVQSVKAYFQLNRSSTSTPDDITVVAAALGAGNWHRLDANFAGPSSWLEETSWYINADTGSDENSGTSPSTPLASFAEFARRLGSKPVVDHAIRVNIDSDLDETLEMEALFTEEEGSIQIIGGLKSVLATDTIRSWVPASATSNSEGNLEGTAIVDFSSYVGRRVRITSGAQTGWYTWISGIAQASFADEIARIGTSGSRQSANNQTTDFITSGAGGAPGDSFQIEELYRVGGLSLTSKRPDGGPGGLSTRLGFVVMGLEIESAHGETSCSIQNDASYATGDGATLLFLCSVESRVKGYGTLILQNVLPGNQSSGAGNLVIVDMCVTIKGLNGGQVTLIGCRRVSVSLNSYVDEGAFELTEGSEVEEMQIGAWHSANEPGVLVAQGSILKQLYDLWGNLANAGASANGIHVQGKAYYADAADLVITHDVGTFDVVLGTNTPQNLAFGALPAQNTIGGGQDDDAIMGIA